MHIVYIATDSYLQLLGISMLSLLEHSDDLESLHLRILSPDLSPQSRQTLEEIAGRYRVFPILQAGHDSRTLSFVDISDYETHFSFSFSTSGFHPIVLARLLIDRYLPEDVRSVLYLDCDVIIHGSIKGLENLPLARYAFAAVPELSMPAAQKAAIGLQKTDTYYNAGVVFLNLDYWRTHRLADSCIAYYRESGGSLLYNDQDILNHCCKGHVLRLSHRYNLSPALAYFPRWFIKSYQPLYYCKKTTYNRILRHPSIIHYLGDERPWMKGNYNPYRSVYEQYKALSPWKDQPMTPGRERFLFCYHILNLITRICPWFRKYFTMLIGIRYYQIAGKK